MIKFKNYIEESITSIPESADTALKNKAEKSGMPLGILRKVYNRGLAAYKTGHRPGATQQQWAMARVNSFTTIVGGFIRPNVKYTVFSSSTK